MSMYSIGGFPSMLINYYPDDDVKYWRSDLAVGHVFHFIRFPFIRNFSLALYLHKGFIYCDICTYVH